MSDYAADLQGWGQLASVVISIWFGVVAALLTWQSSRIAAASIIPFLKVEEEIHPSRLIYNITNVGLGPAVVEEVTIQYPKEPHILVVCKALGEGVRKELADFLTTKAGEPEGVVYAPLINPMVGSLYDPDPIQLHHCDQRDK